MIDCTKCEYAEPCFKRTYDRVTKEASTAPIGLVVCSNPRKDGRPRPVKDTRVACTHYTPCERRGPGSNG